jgi:uncharacterized protein (TIGR04141 family)
MKLTYYLFKRTVLDFDTCVKATKLWGDKPYDEVKLRDVKFTGRAYLQRDNQTPPPWLSFVEDYVDIADADKLFNVTNSFLLLLEVKNRRFAVTAGFGFTAIDRELIEPDFGLKASLNSIAAAKVRGIQSRNVDPTTIQKYIVSNRDVSAAVFDVDFYQELLARLEGPPKDKKVGRKIGGADSCTLDAELEFPQLDAKCKQLLALYGKRDYKKAFPFVDHIRPVRDDAMQQTLNSKLSQHIDDGDGVGLSLALPDISVSGAIDKFRIWHDQDGQKEVDELNPSEVFTYLKERNRKHVDVAKFKIVPIDGNGTAVATSLPLFRCAVFETALASKTYVLTLGKWYEVQPDYVKGVEERLSRRDGNLVIKSANYLPPIKKKESEGPYNTRAATLLGHACMDKNCAPISGVSRIEVCDLFSGKGHFIHVKKETASATLSHLFAQGSVSATLFCDHEPYRDFVAKQLKGPMKKLVNPKKVSCPDFRVVYAITAPPTRKLPDDLPFFSKVNLLYHLQSIERMGYETGLYHVPIQ